MSLTAHQVVQKFAEHREVLATCQRPDLAPYPKVVGAGQSFPFEALLFIESAQDALRELANDVNEFGRYVHHLDAWRKVLQMTHDDERQDVVIEFVRPLVRLLLGLPYAIRGRCIYATCLVSLHANVSVGNIMRPGAWRGGHCTMKDAKDLAEVWKSWGDLAAKLGALNSRSFAELTGNYRNQSEHGRPRSIEIGHVAYIKPEDGVSRSWSFGLAEPISVEKILDPLRDQHQIALATFSGFRGMVEEQRLAALHAD